MYSFLLKFKLKIVIFFLQLTGPLLHYFKAQIFSSVQSSSLKFICFVRSTIPNPKMFNSGMINNNEKQHILNVRIFSREHCFSREYLLIFALKVDTFIIRDILLQWCFLLFDIWINWAISMCVLTLLSQPRSITTYEISFDILGNTHIFFAAKSLCLMPAAGIAAGYNKQTGRCYQSSCLMLGT